MKENNSKKQKTDQPFTIPAENIQGIDGVCDVLKEMTAGAQGDGEEAFNIVWCKTVEVFRERLKEETINDLLAQNIISKTNFNSFHFLKDQVVHPLIIMLLELTKEFSSFVKIISLPGIKVYSEKWSDDLKEFLYSRINIIINNYYRIKTGESVNANIKLKRRSPGGSSKLAISKLYLEIIKTAKGNPTKNFKDTMNLIMEKCDYDYKEKLGLSDEEMKKFNEKVKIKYPSPIDYLQHNFSGYYHKHINKGESIEDISWGLSQNISRSS